MVGDGGSNRRMLMAAVVALTSAASAHPASSAGTGWVAGTTPDRRPEGAPVLSQYLKPPQWLASATQGITQPLPSSLRFLDDQGGWYTPFTRPGMPGPYDIRGLHRAPAATDAPAGPRK